MSKNGVTTGDQRIVAALHQSGGVWRIVVGQRTNGNVSLIDSRAFARSEHHHIDSFLDQHEVGRVIVSLCAGDVICRTVELPNADEEHLGPALALQMETFFSETAPPHRRGMAVLDPADGEPARSGLMTAWPPRADVPEPPTTREVSFASDIAGIAALVNGVRPPDPVMWIDRSNDSVALALAHSQGVTFRAATEPSEDPAEWKIGVHRLLAETAFNVGHSEEYTANVVAGVEGWINDAPAGSGRLYMPRAIQDHARDRLEGATDDAAWWSNFGVAAGVLLAATGSLDGLTTLTNVAPIEQPSLWDRLGNVLGTRRAAALWLIAAVLLIGMGPLTFSGLRLFTLYSKVGDLDAFNKSAAANEARVNIYRELKTNTWPMAKLLGDIGNCAPPGIVFNSIDLEESSDKVQVDGEAESQHLVINMTDTMRESGIFNEVTHTYSERDSGQPQFTISAKVRDAFKQGKWGEDDYATKSLLVRLYPEAARVEVEDDDAAEEEDIASNIPTATPKGDESEDEEVAVAATDDEDEEEEFGRSGPRTTNPIRPKPPVILSGDDDRPRSPRIPDMMTADEIAELDRPSTIASLVKVRNAINLPRLSEDDRQLLREQFEAMAEHLRNLPR